ncbi:MAG: SCO family protein [Deltaproteobacteria bacterium]|nr:SCO family protein [Deltaproteobacteria bacterium]
MDHPKPWRLLASTISVRSRTGIEGFLIVFMAALALFGCNRTSHEFGVYPVTYHASSLPNVTLTDQYGQQVALASLKGKPVLFDFIYTSCPGPCQLLTQHMKLIADKLGPGLGTKVSFVSVTVDPDHDRPSRLLDYARAFNANVKGWYFLTGSPAQIDELLRSFGLGRSRDSNGEIDHVLGYFLVGPDGHEIVDYSQSVDPSIAAHDAEEAAAGSTLIGRLIADLAQF